MYVNLNGCIVPVSMLRFVTTATLHKKVKDICQYLDLNTKIKANSRNITKHLEHFKISLTFLCSVPWSCVLILSESDQQIINAHGPLGFQSAAVLVSQPAQSLTITQHMTETAA